MPEITKQDALRWLDMQRDAVNTEIVYAAPDEKKQYHENLKIINWLAERTQEMTAVEYFEAIDEAPMEVIKEVAMAIAKDNPRHAIDIAKRWKEERL